MGSSSVQRSTAHAQTVLSTRASLDFELLLVSMASPRSLLDVLKAPQASDLTRNDSNPPVGQKRSRGQGSSEPKSVNAKDRVNEFPDECLTVGRGGKLFCSACREELSPRKNIITNHITCKKHWTSKEKVRTSKAKDQTIIDSLRIYDAEHHPACVGETLPMSQYVYRLKVLKTFLRAAIPLTKLDAFRDLLERSENAVRYLLFLNNRDILLNNREQICE